jgi:hypothetical protein
MNTPQYKELLAAVDLLRKYPGASNELDYTLYSVKMMDYLLADSYQNAKLRKPDGKFARNEGILTLGIAGYITEVILRNTHQAKVVIDPADEKWYQHFKVVGETGYMVEPFQLVVKRAAEGAGAALHPFILKTIAAFDYAKNETAVSSLPRTESLSKPWWRFW